MRRSASSRATLRRPAARGAGRRHGRPWGSIRACAPASRSRWSTRPASCSRPTRSIRSSRGTTCGARRRRWRALIARHGVELIAIGNGTASRETERLVGRSCSRLLPAQRSRPKVIVSARPAPRSIRPPSWRRRSSRISTSRCAARSRSRGGCRIRWPSWSRSSRRAIGVGQYQHDVDQHRLGRSLEAVVEDAVNAVGVELNTASAPLLAHVSGLGPALAEAIVAHRNANGPFRSRKDC